MLTKSPESAHKNLELIATVFLSYRVNSASVTYTHIRTVLRVTISPPRLLVAGDNYTQLQLSYTCMQTYI